MTALEQLGSALAGTATPSAAARALVELHLIDTVGAWIAGAHTTEGRALLRFRAAMDVPDGDALALDLATRCALARLSEIDNIHLASMTTPGGIVIPAALTLAAATPSATADDVIAAILAGTEAMTRLGRALDGPAILYRGIWPTYFAAPFAVAAVAARLRRLDDRVTANALALALILAAPGVGHHNAATTSRWFAVGQAARNGLTAALAAQQGFTSDLKLGEGAFLTGIYGVKPDLAAFTDAPGEGALLAEVSFKPWCAARQTMAATQALREIIESGVAPATMEEVSVSVLPPQLKMIDHGVVAGDRASYLTSLPYCMAVAAFAPDMACEVQQTPAATAGGRSWLHGKDQAAGGREPARRLSPHVGGAGERRRRHRAARAHRHPCPRRSCPPVRSRACARQVHALRGAAARDADSRTHPRALRQRARHR